MQHLQSYLPLAVPTKNPEGVIWAKAKTCTFLHEKCNYSHVTSSICTQLSVKLMLTL